MTVKDDTIKNRSEIDPKDTWNVDALYPNLESWEKAYEDFKEQKQPPYWPSLAEFRNRLHESESNIAQTFEKIFSLSRELDKLYTYAHLRHDEDITDDRYKQAYLKISSLANDFQQESAWIEPELLQIAPDRMDHFLRTTTLSPYRFYIEKIVRMRPHTLSIQEEELLAMAGKPLQAPPKAFSALNNADIQFGSITDEHGKELQLTHGLYQLYLRSPDRVLRKNAFLTMHRRFQEFENTLAELLYGQVQSHIFNAKARKYKSALEAALFSKKIPISVYKSLIQTVRDGLPALHRYVKIRKKILQLPEIHFYDMYVPLVSEVDLSLDYRKAQSVVIDSVEPLGAEYKSILEKGFNQERWVDWFENRNKRSGAYSSGCFDSYPYILMNFRGIIRDTFTLAHEAGHSMHSYYSKKHQPYQYSSYPIFVAEVASTFNEELLTNHMLKQLTKNEEKLYLVNEKIEDIRGTLFRQTMFAEFELKIHELVENGTPLTPALLKDLYRDLNKDYFGKELTLDDEIAIEWARIPHFYYNFYVYQYATGISAALALAEKVLEGNEQARQNYLAFISGGSSLYPTDLLKLAGVDMTSPEPVEAAIRKFDSLVSQLETLSK